MKQHPSTARRLRVAVATTAAVALSAGVLLAPSAAEAKPKPKPLKGKLTGTVALSCDFSGSPFDYDAKITITAKRASKSAKPIALTAKMSDMPGVAPVPLDYDVEDSLALTLGSTATTLKGKGHVTTAASSPVPVPPLKGSVGNKKNSLAVTVTEFDFAILGMTMTCTPTESGDLGTLTLK